MAEVETVRVPHLGGTDAAYHMPKAYNPSLPTIVLINSMMTSSALYKPQYANERLTSTANLLAIEVLGHGESRTPSPHFTYWDTAIMALQVLDALDIKGKVFALGTSQGGWIVTRMALLAPDRISGIIPLGTSMDSESDRSRQLGCWDARDIVTGRIKAFSSDKPTPDFKLQPEAINPSLDFGFGPYLDEEGRKFWIGEYQRNYAGEEGRLRARMCAINLRDRDGLHARIGDIRCPVLWMHGTGDKVYSVANAKEEIKLFTGSRKAELKVVQDGQHFLSFSHAKEVDEALVEFVQK